MTARVAAIRADASPEIGGGHVMRCLTLADVLTLHGWTCNFFCSKQTPRTVTALERSRHELFLLSDRQLGSAGAIFRELPQAPDLIVIDAYSLFLSFEKECAGAAGRVLVISDAPDRDHHCDLLLDQTFGRTSDAYSGYVPEECTLLCGSSYALIRPEFAALRDQSLRRREIPKPITRILVAMGMTDPLRMTGLALDAIEKCALAAGVDVIIGPGASGLAEVRERAARSAGRIRLHVDPPNSAELVAAADVAIGAAGSAAWERCCLGLPTLTLQIADNQKHVMANLASRGAILPIALGHDPSDTVSMIADALNGLDDARIRDMAQIAAGICDGEGATRVAEAILP